MNPMLAYYWLVFLKVGLLVVILLGVLTFDQLWDLWRTRLPSWLEDMRVYNELEHQDLVGRCRAGRLVACRRRDGKRT